VTSAPATVRLFVTAAEDVPVATGFGATVVEDEATEKQHVGWRLDELGSALTRW
jgi:hypothetical protein